MVADNGGVVRPSLDIIKGNLRCLSNDGDSSYEGGKPL
jgi:hypothetical protein